MKKVLSLWVIAILCIAIFPKSKIDAQESKTVPLTPSADATIIGSSPDNFGNSSALSCSNIVNGDGGEYKSFLIKFDLGVIQSNAIIQSATITLTQIDGEGDSVTMSVYKVTEVWDEDIVSGVRMPNFDSKVTYGAIGLDGTVGQRTFSQNFSDLVQGWLQDPTTNFGLYFKSNLTSTYDHKFGSRESASSPVLSITYSIPDEDAPAITSVTVINIADSSAEISWKTDEEASSFVDLGETSDYGIVVGGSELRVEHSITLASLSPDTLYHFRVRSEDIEGNEAVSTDYTFTTLSKEEDILPPKTDETVSEGIIPPMKLKLTSSKDGDKHYVELAWEHSEEEDFDGYRIYRSEEDEISYVQIAEVDSDTTDYKDEDVVEGKTYFYVVRTVKGDLESSDSNEEVITIYRNDIEEQLDTFNFWKGFLVFNIIALPIFGVWYLRNKRRKQKRGKGRRKKPKSK